MLSPSRRNMKGAGECKAYQQQGHLKEAFYSSKDVEQYNKGVTGTRQSCLPFNQITHMSNLVIVQMFDKHVQHILHMS